MVDKELAWQLWLKGNPLARASSEWGIQSKHGWGFFWHRLLYRRRQPKSSVWSKHQNEKTWLGIEVAFYGTLTTQFTFPNEGMYHIRSFGDLHASEFHLYYCNSDMHFKVTHSWHGVRPQLISIEMNFITNSTSVEFFRSLFSGVRLECFIEAIMQPSHLFHANGECATRWTHPPLLLEHTQGVFLWPLNMH